jgi:hypothetical protein
MSKSVSKRDALKHGLYSREPMLPGEKKDDYEGVEGRIERGVGT